MGEGVGRPRREGSRHGGGCGHADGPGDRSARLATAPRAFSLLHNSNITFGEVERILKGQALYSTFLQRFRQFFNPWFWYIYALELRHEPALKRRFYLQAEPLQDIRERVAERLYIFVL